MSGIKPGMLNQLCDFFKYQDIDDDWILRNISIEFYDNNRDVVITIKHMNCQEYAWLKDEL